MKDGKINEDCGVFADVIHSESAYQIIGSLGQGGMGSVYKAIRVTGGNHKQIVALKFVRDRSDATSCEALIREARRISEIRHDNIVSFVDSGTTKDGRLFIALEYIPGLDLNQLLDMHGLNKKSLLNWRKPSRIPDPIVGFIMLMAARALDAAHTHEFEDGKIGLVNRDVSPDNFVIEKKFGFVKQIDFGVAETIDDIKLMHEQSEKDRSWHLAGKLFYMAPEEINNEESDARTDIYALGLVGRKLITGLDQFDSLDPNANFMRCLYNIMAAQTQPLVPLSEIVIGVDEQLAGILAKMTCPKVESRYSSAATLRADLEDYLYTKEGKGPTVTSLQTYIKLMKARATNLDDREMDSMKFLKDPRSGKIKLYEPYIMTSSAKHLWQKNINPATQNS